MAATALNVISILVGSLAILFLKHHASRKIDAREPPVVSSAIPYVGHLLGMLFSGSRYFKQLGRKNAYPIFTLPTLNSRFYVVTDPSLATSVQRSTKSLSFNPIIPPVLQSVYGFDKPTTRLIESDMTHGFVQQVQEKVHSRLGYGSYLDQLSLRACNEFLFQLRGQDDDGVEIVDLLRWIKRLVTVSTAAFFYGPNNPVKKDPTLIDKFWNFDAGIPKLLIGMMPWLTAGKAYKGREAMVTALKDYLNSPQYTEAADLTKERTEIARRFGVDDENSARSDLTFFFAGIINTSLTSFWMILHIFADRNLLSSIRDELKSTVTYPDKTGDTGNQAAAANLSISKIVKQCQLLDAVFREVLRLYSDNFATRVVLTDTLLADTYFLRAGSIVQISGGIIHADSKIWGPDVSTFRPERFLRLRPSVTAAAAAAATTSTTASSESDHIDSTRVERKRNTNIHPAAFRAFGGGSTLCPGRHFALNEILGFVALVVLIYDVDAAGDGNNKLLKIPRKNDGVVPIHVLEPVGKVNVRIRRVERSAVAGEIVLEA